MTGEKHNTETVAYGLHTIIDGLETSAVIMLLVPYFIISCGLKC